MRPAHLVAAVVAAAVGILAVVPAGDAANRPRLPAAGTVTTLKVIARELPDPAAAAVHVFRDFRKDYRPQYVFALHQREGADGRPWVHVELPMRPNGLRGWIPAASADLRPVSVTVVVRRGERRLAVYRNGRRTFTTIVAVGKPGAETPLGSFYVTARFTPTDAFYGPFALETSAYSRLSDWPGGGIVASTERACLGCSERRSRTAASGSGTTPR